MKKKFAAAILILVLVCCALLLTACGGDGEKIETVDYTDENGVVYTLYKVTGTNTENYVKVTGYTGKKVGLPPDNQVTVDILPRVTIEGTEYPVTAVGNMAFHRAEVTKITVPENVTKIEPFTFAYCEAGEIVLPSTVTEIGEYAFVNCNSLKIVRVGSVTPPTLGGYVFMFYNGNKNVYEVAQYVSIRVPSESKDAYLNAWHEYASIIK